MMLFLADSYLHCLDPFAIRFSGSFGIRWYGLSYAVGFIIAWLLIRALAVRGRILIKPQHAWDFIAYVIVGVLLGGRLGYVLFYDLPRALESGATPLLWEFTSSVPFWGMLAINKGGMASHGGMAGVILACVLFARRHHISPLHLFDSAIACTPGLFLGRIANFINAELWGRAIPASMQSYVPGGQGSGFTGIDPPSWSVKYPQEVTESWLEIINSPEKYTSEMVEDARQRLDALTQQLSPFISDHGSFFQRVVSIACDENHTAHQQVLGTLKPLLTAFYPSQLMQAVTDGPILVGVLALIWLRPRKPGVIGSWFLILYAGLRVVTEQFRQPDAGVPPLWGLISRGQQLSIVMMLIGFAMLVYCARRNAPRTSGLRSLPQTPDSR